MSASNFAVNSWQWGQGVGVGRSVSSEILISEIQKFVTHRLSALLILVHKKEKIIIKEKCCICCCFSPERQVNSKQTPSSVTSGLCKLCKPHELHCCGFHLSVIPNFVVFQWPWLFTNVSLLSGDITFCTLRPYHSCTNQNILEPTTH